MIFGLKCVYIFPGVGTLVPSYEDVTRVMAELDSDRSNYIDFGEFEDWYMRQPGRKVNASGKKEPVFVVSVGEYAASRGVRVGAKIVSVQGKDMRQAPLREVMGAIRAGREGTKQGKVMKMVIERLAADHAPAPQVEPQVSRGHTLLTVTLQKEKKQTDFGMTLSPKLKVLSMPRAAAKKAKDKHKPGPVSRPTHINCHRSFLGMLKDGLCFQVEKAGVQIGQVLVSINGKKLSSVVCTHATLITAWCWLREREVDREIGCGCRWTPRASSKRLAANRLSACFALWPQQKQGSSWISWRRRRRRRLRFLRRWARNRRRPVARSSSAPFTSGASTPSPPRTCKYTSTPPPKCRFQGCF